MQIPARVFVSCLLILSIVSTLSSSNAHGQGVSTFTSIVSSNWTSIVSTTTTETLTLNETFDLAPYRSSGCDEHAFPFTMTKGFQVSAIVSTNASVLFVVMSDDRYAAWTDKHDCSVAQTYSIYTGAATNAHPLTFKWRATSPGNFWFVLLNIGNSVSHVQLQSNSPSLYTITIASRVSSGVVETYFYLYTTKYLTQFTSNTTVPPSAPSTSGQLPVALVVATIILALLVILTYRRLQSTRPQTT